MVRYEMLYCLLSYMAHSLNNLTCANSLIITVMLNENGYCVVVDMGFAKVVMDKTYTMCG